LPGIVQAFIEAPIYARTSGYVKAWHTDIGAHVHRGELLAEIETPEVDRQLSQAKADLATAQRQSGALADHQRALAGTAENAIGLRAGRRREVRGRGCQESER
jgi:multidrug efflux pump subunit AcrA (membrane-fusion protein)